MKSLIYKATNKKTGHSYIGRTGKSLELRKEEHRKEATMIGTYKMFYNAIRKYGWDSFEWSVLEDDVPYNKIKERERYWIDYYDTEQHGYNMTIDGKYPSNNTESTTKKVDTGDTQKNEVEKIETPPQKTGKGSYTVLFIALIALAIVVMVLYNHNNNSNRNNNTPTNRGNNTIYTPTNRSNNTVYTSCEQAKRAGIKRIQGRHSKTGKKGGGCGYPQSTVPSAKDGDNDGIVCEDWC